MTAQTAPAEPYEIARIWSGYASMVYGSYSPLNAALARAVSKSRAVLDLLCRQPPHAHDPNMLLAAIQFLVLGGSGDPLAASYAPGAVPPDDVTLSDQLESFCADNEGELSRILATRRIQTNEVGRAGGLALGLACAAQFLGEPFTLLDAGASAGLNLLLDQYRLGYGEAGQIGPTSSPVQIECRVEPCGMEIPFRLPDMPERVGLDRDPVDLTISDNRRWLLGCIWPGTGRQDRAAAAMELAAEQPPRLVKGDMVTDLADVIRELRPGPIAVVTSWSFSYLSLDERPAFESVLSEAGRDGPIAWVCCDVAGTSDLFQPNEPPPDEGDIPSVLGLATFEGGTVNSHCLAYMHSHGSWVKWLDPSMTPRWP